MIRIIVSGITILLTLSTFWLCWDTARLNADTYKRLKNIEKGRGLRDKPLNEAGPDDGDKQPE